MRAGLKSLAAVAGAGFILGSKAGRSTYERLEGMVRGVTNRPEVKKSLNAVTESTKRLTGSAVDLATERVDEAAEKVQQKVASASH